MAASIAGVFEENLQKKIIESKILVVGAGGIGCEVLKNLVLSGFSDIEIVSMNLFGCILGNVLQKFQFYCDKTIGFVHNSFWYTLVSCLNFTSPWAYIQSIRINTFAPGIPSVFN